MDYYLQRWGHFHPELRLFVLPHWPIFFPKSVPLRSVAFAVSLKHIEYSKSPLLLSEGFLVILPCHSWLCGCYCMNNYSLGVTSHDVEVEAEAALEALRTFCRNTTIDKH